MSDALVYWRRYSRPYNTLKRERDKLFLSYSFDIVSPAAAEGSSLVYSYTQQLFSLAFLYIYTRIKGSAEKKS